MAALLSSATLAGGCGASLDSMTTGSLFGGSAKATAAAPQDLNNPVARALQVGGTSARAIKCGFNFDPAKLKAQFLSAEAGVNPADAAKIAQVYDTSFNGVSKAVSGEGENYCSAAKTAKIKEALTRHLAGDFTPAPPEPVAEEEGGLFGDLGASSGPGKDPSMKHPIDDLH